jgi:hypothetical protein
MQLLKRGWLVESLGAMAAGLALTTSAGAWEEAQAPSAQVLDAQPSLQGTVSGAPTAVVPQSPVAYQTVNTVEAVTVPVTQMQTQYRTEYRTENLPVTRMVPETINETRTITRFIPQQETITKQVITDYVCEPVTTIKKCYRPIPMTKNVTRTRYQTYCTTEIVTKEITNYVPECVTETVPVTKTHKVVEQELTYVTQKVPVTSMVPVVTCAHTCGHKCGGGGCGACGGVTTCVGYQPVTTYACQQVPVMRPTVKCVPETTYVQRTRTKMMPVKQTVQVPQRKVNRIPYQVTECVAYTEYQSYDVPVTRMVKRPIYGTVPVCVTKMVPESTTVVVPTVKCRPVTETVSRQVAVCVPYQVPVTVMTTQMQTVAHQVPVTQPAPVPAGSSQAIASPQ